MTSASSTTVTYTSTDSTNSSGVASVELWTRFRTNDNASPGDWTLATSSSSASGTFTLSFGSGTGVYDVATVAVDSLGNREATTLKSSIRAISWAALGQGQQRHGIAVQDDVAYASAPTAPLCRLGRHARRQLGHLLCPARPLDRRLVERDQAQRRRRDLVAADALDRGRWLGQPLRRLGRRSRRPTDTDIYFTKRTGTTWSANIKVSSATEVRFRISLE